MHKHLLSQVKTKKSVEDIDCLTDLLGMMLDKAKEEHPKFYEHIENQLYEMIYGKTLTREKAEKAIMSMRPYRMHWSEEEVEEVLREHNMDLPIIDAWVVMNMAYNDFHEMFKEDLEMYLEYTKLFIKDEDAKPGKVYTYITEIPE